MKDLIPGQLPGFSSAKRMGQVLGSLKKCRGMIKDYELPVKFSLDDAIREMQNMKDAEVCRIREIRKVLSER